MEGRNPLTGFQQEAEIEIFDNGRVDSEQDGLWLSRYKCWLSAAKKSYVFWAESYGYGPKIQLRQKKEQLFFLPKANIYTCSATFVLG